MERFYLDNRRFSLREPARIARYCRTFWPEETEHVLRVADEVCRKYFVFDFPWDMERTYEPVSFDGLIDWCVNPHGDREFTWQFNRHRFFIALGQAYQMTGDERYAKAYVELMSDWIDRVHLSPEPAIDPWRALETGIRGETWTKSILYFEKSPWVDDGLISTFCQSMREHGRRLMGSFSDDKYISNWGVMESVGLLLIGLILPISSETERFVSTALSRMELTAKLQVMGDGTHWEQSPMYHNEVFHSYLTAIHFAGLAGIEMPQAIAGAAEKMAQVNLKWKKPNHCQFIQGDSDSTDLRSQLTAGAWIFRSPALKFGGYERLDYESAWNFGFPACEEYERMPVMPPEFTSVALADSGNYYLRSSWSENGNLLHFHCGDMGAAHGHADKLHFDLVMGGEDALVDSGRYTYVEGEDRFEFKGADAHNIALVDKEFFTVCETSWICGKLCTAVKQPFLPGKTAELVQGGHLGYIHKGMYTNRKIVWIRPDIYVIADAFYGGGSHEYEIYFHWSRTGNFALENSFGVFRGEKNEVFLRVLDTDVEMRVKATRQSDHYNLAQPNQTLVCRKTGDGFTSLITVINGGPAGAAQPLTITRVPAFSVIRGTEFERQQVEALKIVSGEREYILVICHQEVFSPADMVRVENCLGYGSVILFDKSGKGGEAILTGEVLAW